MANHSSYPFHFFFKWIFFSMSIELFSSAIYDENVLILNLAGAALTKGIRIPSVVQKLRPFYWRGGFGPLVELHQEGSSPAACTAGFYFWRKLQNVCPPITPSLCLRIFKGHFFFTITCKFNKCPFFCQENMVLYLIKGKKKVV